MWFNIFLWISSLNKQKSGITLGQFTLIKLPEFGLVTFFSPQKTCLINIVQ